MKKLLFAAVAVFAFSFANAQEETTEGGFSQGDVFVTGSFGINSSKTGDFKSSQFSIAPSVGYFATENIAVGAKVSYSSLKDGVVTNIAGIDLGGASLVDFSTFGAGVFGRYYFTPADKFSLFANLGVDYATTTVDKVNGTELDDDNKINAFKVGAGLGVNYFISSNFALEAGVGVLDYTSSKLDAEGTESTDTFNFAGNLTNLTLGLTYKF